MKNKIGNQFADYSRGSIYLNRKEKTIKIKTLKNMSKTKSNNNQKELI